MAVKAEKQINSFIRGLITESSPLTYPENASLDEDNFVLNRDGSRSRRLGMEYEDDYVLRNLGVVDIEKISFHEWKISGGEELSIGVVRAYDKLWFFNMLDRSPSTFILNGGSALTIPFLTNSEISTAVINNAFIIVSQDLPYPVRLSYDSNTDTVDQKAYTVLVRDVWGVEDGLIENERPTVISKTHKYNLRNQGWATTVQSICGNDAIDCTKVLKGVYPSNADVWTYGKVADSSSADYQKYSPHEMFRNMHDFSIAPKGKHIIDVFNRGASRQTASLINVSAIPITTYVTKSMMGSALAQATYEWQSRVSAASVVPVDVTQDLPIDQESGAFTSFASFAGRIFYSGVRTALLDGDSKSPNYSGYVFFTQTVVNEDKLMRCYQEADPTSEEISDIVDTDGGTIQITDAINIVALIPTKSALLVFAENGVWSISGGRGNFSATEYEQYKVSSIGCKNRYSIVAVNNEVFYWAKGGIFRIVFDDTDGGLKSENISLTSIQTLYNDIPDIAKEFAKGVLEERENKIRWIYNDEITYNGESKYNRELILDLTLGAFYTNTIDSSTVYIADFIKIPDYAESQTVDEVVVGTNAVLVTSLDEVIVDRVDFTQREGGFNYLAVNPTTLQFTFAKYKDSTFKDWTVATGGVNYTSYLVTGYDIFGEVMRKKSVPYILFYFDRTENGYEDDGSGNLVLSNPSSCIVQAQWNWANSINSGKWGSSFQAYRLLRNYIPSGVGDTFDYGDRVIVTKNRLRGSGRALSLKIVSEEGKDMKLLGWAMTVIGDSVP